MKVDLNTPLWKLTVGEFLYLQKEAEKPEEAEKPVKMTDYTQGDYVFGISGIAKLLGVSRTTIHQYRQDGWIEPAISQRDRMIICDAEMAIELFNNRKKTKK